MSEPQKLCPSCLALAAELERVKAKSDRRKMALRQLNKAQDMFWRGAHWTGLWRRKHELDLENAKLRETVQKLRGTP